jgi:hypothetical protein
MYFNTAKANRSPIGKVNIYYTFAGDLQRLASPRYGLNTGVNKLRFLAEGMKMPVEIRFFWINAVFVPDFWKKLSQTFCRECLKPYLCAPN